MGIISLNHKLKPRLVYFYYILDINYVIDYYLYKCQFEARNLIIIIKMIFRTILMHMHVCFNIFIHISLSRITKLSIQLHTHKCVSVEIRMFV